MAKIEVRDGYLSDLPEDFRNKIMNIHKMIVDGVHEEFNRKNYDYLWNQQWCKDMLAEFLTMPTDKSEVGSVRVFKKGKRYSCMIQVTAHVMNNRNTEDEEFFHGMIRNAHTSLRAKIRKKFDLKLECESIHGEPFEGYDIWATGKTAKSLWELFENKKTKVVKEMRESTDHEVVMLEMNELPPQLQYFICSTNCDICNIVDQNKDLHGAFNDVTDLGTTTIHRIGESYSGIINITSDANCDNDNAKEILENVLNKVGDKYFESDNTKELVISGTPSNVHFEYELSPSYAKALYSWVDNNQFTEASGFLFNIGDYSFKVVPDKEMYTVYNPDGSFRGNYDSSYRQDIEDELKNELVTESANNEKDTFIAFAKSILNKSMTKSNANTYSTLLNPFVKSCGYDKFNLIIDNKLPKGSVIFKVEKFDKDFISRFIYGRETLDGFLHRNPVIVLKVNPNIFIGTKNGEDIYNFFMQAINFYNSDVANYSKQIMTEVMRLNSDMKQLIATTKLSAIVSLPLQMLFSFDNIDITKNNIFKVDKKDIQNVCNFIRSICKSYKSPKEQQDEIIDQLKSIVESYEGLIEEMHDVRSIVEYVDNFYNGLYDDKLDSFKESWVYENTNTDWERSQKDPEIKLLQEKFGVKKLKKIPKDLVAYITIEAECIKDANDKMMIASFCLSKLEIVEWYLELLEVGSKKYIVPHTKAELDTIHTQLLACYKKIMDTPIPKNTTRPLIDIQYPAGYEG